jgi:hypothetical protein
MIWSDVAVTLLLPIRVILLNQGCQAHATREMTHHRW